MSQTEKVLPGISRTVLGLIASRWRDLAKMSVIPFFAYGIGSVFLIKSMSSMYRQMATMIVGDQMNPEFFGAYFRMMAASFVFSILGMVVMGLLFVEIVRFRRSGEAPWIALDGASLKAALMTMLYALGMMLLTMAAYFGVVIVLMILAGVLGAIMGAITGGEGAAFMIFIALIIGFTMFLILGFLYWFMFRFLVGLPGVALGHSPDFFRDIWPLAKGEGFGVPLRVFLATLIFNMPFAVVFAAAALLGSTRFPADAFSTDTPERAFLAIADLMDGMIYALPIAMVLFMPFMWFVSLLLAEAFDRFRARNEAQASFKK